MRLFTALIVIFCLLTILATPALCKKNKKAKRGAVNEGGKLKNTAKSKSSRKSKASGRRLSDLDLEEAGDGDADGVDDNESNRADEKYSRALYRAIESLERWNPSKARTILTTYFNQPSRRLVGDVSGSVPVLHHLLNLFLRNARTMDKRVVTEIIELCITNGKADANKVFGNEPPLLLKAFLLGEHRLIRLLTEHSASTIKSLVDDRSFWLHKHFAALYRIIGDPVTISKHMTTLNDEVPTSVVQRAKFEFLVDVAKKIDMRPRMGTRVVFNPVELVALSPTFNESLRHLASRKASDFDFPVMSAINIAAEVVSPAHRALLDILKQYVRNNFKAATDVLSMLQDSYSDFKRRNIFHFLFASGSHLAVDEMFELLSMDIFRDLHERIAYTLVLKDLRGHSAVSYALIRYNHESDMPFMVSAMRFFSFFSVDVNAIADEITTVADMYEEFNALYPRQHAPDPSIGTSIYNKKLSGGWRLHRVEELADPSDGCDILEVKDLDQLPTNKEFFEEYLNEGRPVVFRGVGLSPDGLGATAKTRELLARQPFLQDWGNSEVTVVSTGHENDFESEDKVITVAELAANSLTQAETYIKERVARRAGETAEVEADGSASLKGKRKKGMGKKGKGKKGIDASNEPGSSTRIPSYIFSSSSVRKWIQDLSEIIPVPESIRRDIGADSDSRFGDYANSTQAWPHTMEFYLGPPGSGIRMHFHTHALNTLAYGEKRWFFHPPQDSYMSSSEVMEFALDARPNATGMPLHHPHARGKPIWQCTQRAGDVLFIPSLWTHATLNLRESIGVTHFFDVEDFFVY